jgi:DNA-binding CsgD family transcriptional regulator/tetratricopeptide (TPR) repeat protein
LPSRAGLVGRDDELVTLVEAIERDQTVVVVGEAGIGKTALIRAAVARSGRRAHEGGGFATLRSVPYLALQRALDSEITGDSASAAAVVERHVGPDILFLDDLQWIDDNTLAVLDLIDGRILVLAAIRSGDPGAAAALACAERLAATLIGLEGLADEAATQIVRRAEPGLSLSRAAEIVRQAGGNPLLLEELATAREPSSPLARALASRVDLLTPAGQRLLEVLAVTEGPLRLADGDVDAVGELVGAGLVVERRDGFEIRHSLVADAIGQRMTTGARRRAHLRAAGLVDNGLERARQLAAAGRRGAAVATALDELTRTEEPRRRAALLATAADASPTASGASLRLHAARALDEVAEWAAIVRILDAPERGATAEEQVEREAILAHAAFALGQVEVARAHLAAAVERTIDESSSAALRRVVEEATLMVNLAGEVGPAIARLDSALLAQPAGSPAARELGVLRAAIVMLATGEGDAQSLDDAIDDALRHGRLRTAADRARVVQYLLLMGGGGADDGLGYLLEQTARFDRAGFGAAALEFQADAAVASHLAGHLEQAVGLADEVLERPVPPRARQTAQISRARSLTLLGRFEQAADASEPLVATASPDFFGRGELLTVQAELAYWSGRPSAAVTFAEAALDVPAPLPIARVLTTLVHAWARFDADLRLDRSTDVRLTRSLAGARPELEGLRQWHAGDHAAGARSFATAAELWTGFHAPRALIARWAQGESMRRTGQQGAVQVLAAALTDAVQMGFEPLAVRIRRSLRLAGVRAARPTPGRQPRAGQLTPREREVVDLVQRGLTNVEIARRLGLGRPTVARMLSSAMSKLGAGSRAQLAASVPAT